MKPAHQPLVSVCVAAYNVEQFVADSLRSILDQTYRNMEVVVVDDGSADHTFDVLQSFRDERLRCIRLATNSGGFQAMNRAVSEARGEFVAIYHSDDTYEPTIVEREVAYLTSHPSSGAVFTMYHMMTAQGVVFGSVDLPSGLAGREQLTGDEIIPYQVRLGNVMFCTPSVMLRRDVFASVGPFDAETWDIVADLDLWLRILRVYPVGIINEHLLHYRHNSAQWTQRWRKLRTAPDRAIELLEQYIEKDNWLTRLSPADLVELEYRRCDDATTRAANAVVLGDEKLAVQLLAGQFPLRTLLRGIRRRKVRVLFLRGLMRAAFAVGATRPLAALLSITEQA